MTHPLNPSPPLESENTVYDQYCAIAWLWCEIRSLLLVLFTNIKWHTGVRSVTLNDLEPRIRVVQHCAATFAAAELLFGIYI